MKSLIDAFKQSLLSETSKDTYVDDGSITIYHYAPTHLRLDTLMVDPKYFADAATRSSFSRNEYAISTVPRTFFYVNPKQREYQVAQGRTLYSSEIPASNIYDLRADPEGFIEKFKHPVYGLRKGVEWDDLLNALREAYDGIFYGGRFDVVSLFVPQLAHKVSESARELLE